MEGQKYRREVGGLGRMLAHSGIWFLIIHGSEQQQRLYHHTELLSAIRGRYSRTHQHLVTQMIDRVPLRESTGQTRASARYLLVFLGKPTWEPRYLRKLRSNMARSFWCHLCCLFLFSLHVLNAGFVTRLPRLTPNHKGHVSGLLRNKLHRYQAPFNVLKLTFVSKG